MNSRVSGQCSHAISIKCMVDLGQSSLVFHKNATDNMYTTLSICFLGLKSYASHVEHIPNTYFSCGNSEVFLKKSQIYSDIINHINLIKCHVYLCKRK